MAICAYVIELWGSEKTYNLTKVKPLQTKIRPPSTFRTRISRRQIQKTDSPSQPFNL